MGIPALSGIDSFLRLVTLLIVFALVLTVTYFVTRWIGGYQKEKFSKGNIKIIEAKQIGTNKFIYIAQIGNEYYALSAGKENLSVIDKIDASGLTLPEDNDKTMIEPFSAVLNKVKNLKKPKE